MRETVGSSKVGELIASVARKFIMRSREEAVSLLNNLPEVAEFVLFSNNYDEMVEEARRAGLEIIAEIPLVKAIVVRGDRDRLLSTLSLDVVEAVDTPRRVKALGGSM